MSEALMVWLHKSSRKEGIALFSKYLAQLDTHKIKKKNNYP